MRDICYKFLLIILRTGNFTCHIGNGGTKIADLILTVNLKFIMHISGSILFCGLCNLSKGQINHLCKKDQNDHGKQEQNDQHQVRNIKQAVAGSNEITHGIVNDYIAPYLVVGCDRGENTELFL